MDASDCHYGSGQRSEAAFARQPQSPAISFFLGQSSESEAHVSRYMTGIRLFGRNVAGKGTFPDASVARRDASLYSFSQHQIQTDNHFSYLMHLNEILPFLALSPSRRVPT